MVILAYYINPQNTREFVDGIGNLVREFFAGDPSVKSCILLDSGLPKGDIRVECVYPKFVFEHEEKEISDLAEVIVHLQERLRQI